MTSERFHADGWFGEHEALWADPKPTTPEGQHLWRLFMLGKLGTSPSGIRDFGQRVCQIEAEAASAMKVRVAELEAAKERLMTALRVASHEPHDQAGKPVQGFPVCSVCGAIQVDEVQI